MPTGLFLGGFSEGGHAALAVHRRIERAPISGLALVATAPVAAAVDLAGLGVAGALTGASRFASLYLAWIAKSYAAYYGEPLGSVLRAPWIAVVEEYFDGNHDGDATVAALPADPRAPSRRVPGCRGSRRRALAADALGGERDARLGAGSAGAGVLRQ